MKITDLKSALIDQNTVLRVVTDKGIDGYSQIEIGKDYQRSLIPFFKNMIVGCDPTNVDQFTAHDVAWGVALYGNEYRSNTVDKLPDYKYQPDGGHIRSAAAFAVGTVWNRDGKVSLAALFEGNEARNSGVGLDISAKTAVGVFVKDFRAGVNVDTPVSDRGNDTVVYE